MTDATDTPADEPTFVCLKCLQRLPVSQRHADDEPFDTACFEANQAAEAARQAHELAEQQRIAQEQAAADAAIDALDEPDEDPNQGNLFQ